LQSTKPLLIVSASESFSKSTREKLSEALNALGESTGYKVALFTEGLTPTFDNTNAALKQLTVIADNQARTNELLAALVEALADDADPDQEPRTYLNGQPIA